MGKRTQPFQLGSFQDSTVGERTLADVTGRKESRGEAVFPPITSHWFYIKEIICYSCCETHCPGEGKPLGKSICVCQSVEFINLIIWEFNLDPVHVLKNWHEHSHHVDHRLDSQVRSRPRMDLLPQPAGCWCKDAIAELIVLVTMFQETSLVNVVWSQHAEKS